MKEKIKLVVIVVVVVIAIAMVWAKATTPTKTVRACVTSTEYIRDDCYLVTVEYAHNLWGYYDSIPRETGCVIMVTFRGDEIIKAEGR